MLVRLLPSRSVNDRCTSRPCAITREPFSSDSATFSAASRQIVERRNSASPSTHSFRCLSKVRGVDAMVKFATATPDWVKRSSGSAVRLPITVMVVSFAMSGGLLNGVGGGGPAVVVVQHPPGQGEHGSLLRGADPEPRNHTPVRVRGGGVRVDLAVTPAHPVTTHGDEVREPVRVRARAPLPVVRGLCGPPADDTAALVPLPRPAALAVVVGAALEAHADCSTGNALPRSANAARICGSVWAPFAFASSNTAMSCARDSAALTASIHRAVVSSASSTTSASITPSSSGTAGEGCRCSGCGAGCTCAACCGSPAWSISSVEYSPERSCGNALRSANISAHFPIISAGILSHIGPPAAYAAQ